MMTKKTNDALHQQITELTNDLQRTRADFENYRKRVEAEKTAAREAGEAGAILKLLPVIDTIERAVLHLPDHLKDDKWAAGIAGLVKNLEKTLENLGLKRIDASRGTGFNPELHEAVQFDEDAVGDKEVVAGELQAGYMHKGRVVRPSMVKATRE
jgi:molecular chaperone GrpE